LDLEPQGSETEALRVWFYGTSLTAASILPAATRVRDSVPTRVGARLAQRTGRPVEVTNRGEGGRMFVCWIQPGAATPPIVSTMLLDIDSTPPEQRPHAVYSEGGINDLLHTTKQSIYQTHLVLNEAVQSRGIGYLPVTIAPVTATRGAADYAPDRGWINDALRGTDPGVFAGLVDADAALTAGGFLPPEYDVGDGLHWNPYGNLRVADAFPLSSLTS
jgi:hypothetical protein